MTQDAMVYVVSSVSFFMAVSSQLELGLTPFSENCRTYNSMLCVLLLRILGPITLCVLSWDL